MGFRRHCSTCNKRWDFRTATGHELGFCPDDGAALGPAQLDRYQLIRPVARSDMSEVFEAKHTHTGRRVALKLIDADHVALGETAARLRREGRAASAIGDPNIVDVLDFGNTEEGDVYMVMEWLEGRTLREVIHNEQPELSVLLDIAEQIASGLSAAHKIGVIHRDVKPDNVIVSASKSGDLVAKILDFGIAKTMESNDRKLTRTGTIIGTPAYMAPEQARGETVDARSDIYSLGCVLYEMLTGEPPFVASSPMELVHMHLNLAPQDPLLRAPQRYIPARLAQVVMQCLAKVPAQRPGSMQQLRAALKEAVQENSPTLEEQFDGAATAYYEPRSRAPSQPAYPPQDLRSRAPSQPAYPPQGLHSRAPSQPAYPPQDLRSRAPSQPAYPPRDSFSPPTSSRRWGLATALVLFAGATLVTLVLLLRSQDDPGKAGSTASAHVDRDAGKTGGAKTGGAKTGAGEHDPNSSDAGTDARPKSGAEIGEPWSFEAKERNFRMQLEARPLPLLVKEPIRLDFALKEMSDSLSYAVTEGRLDVRVDFVHFVKHGTLGSVRAKADDRGAFSVVLSVPQSGKYHLKVKLTTGKRVLGRSVIDICVGANPDSELGRSLCPNLNEDVH